MAQLVKTTHDLAIASTKTVLDVAIASVKTIGGVDNTSGGGFDWSNLVAFWPMDEASGNSRLDAVGSIDLAETGGTIASATGLVYANAADFEKADSRYLLASSAGALHPNNADKAFSLGLWVKPESLTDFDGLISTNNSTTFDLVYRDSTRLRWAVAGTEQDYTTTLTTGNWFFIVVGYSDSGNTMFVSVNGAAKTSAANANSRSTSATTFSVGRSSIPQYFDGIIGPVMWFDTILSDTRISDLYNAGAGVVYP